MSEAQLEILAGRAGLAVDWIDANGQPQRVAQHVLEAILAGLGLPADSAEAIETSLLNLQLEQQNKRLPPLLTADVGKALDLSRYFHSHSQSKVHLENGESLEIQLDADAMLPGMIPIGYHRVQIEDQHFTLAVAPAKCFSIGDALQQSAPRAWGLGVQLYSLRRDGDGGFGDTRALETLLRAAGERGADALAISPVHAMFSSAPQHYSPYSPSSRLFLNSVYAEPSSILGGDALDRAIETTGLRDELQRLQALPLIDWPAATRAKQTLLRQLYEDFVDEDSALMSDFQRFRDLGGEALENHCRFEALQAVSAAEQRSLDWREWPEQLRNPDSPALLHFAEEHAHLIAYYAFCQWLIARCLDRAQTTARGSGMAIGLIADLAVGADGAGSQAWCRQDELLAQLTVGAPPDQLNRAGQGWGISAFSPEGLKRNGFRAFIEMLRANFAHAGGLRIDHVLGLQRLWVIPLGAPSNEGAYLYYPVDDLLRLVALESVRHQAIVLGEDLGTVPDGLREKLSERAILGIRVLLFEQDFGAHFKPILAWPDDALATTSTHDLPTLTGWLQGRDIDWNEDLNLIDPVTANRWRENRHRECEGLDRALRQDPQNFQEETQGSAPTLDASIRFLGHTRAPLVLLPIEDALGLVEQANLPGTVSGHPNWCRRLPGDCSALLDAIDATRRFELLACARLQAHERDR
ncbi:4-alpha-glucanotransferase [Pseudomonas sp. CCC3.1]|uniref:4-alpha-glucanotransferase n=1 Tax=Pseudomonas sp. CCC3.1 TaxID=3048607 RepID=UPI002AC8D676|nr:4-alpha-glucanotransferase [Pseudomonas sp. CCC3.1]MEB0205356.1 4-alpha-glucanotransferase [Pseudomonas sp. CCC3.1]WPX34683.1 4-alpha-glucanotransferase [Pseudomonas sp. CCC3.1]